VLRRTLASADDKTRATVRVFPTTCAAMHIYLSARSRASGANDVCVWMCTCVQVGAKDDEAVGEGTGDSGRSHQ